MQSEKPAQSKSEKLVLNKYLQSTSACLKKYKTFEGRANLSELSGFVSGYLFLMPVTSFLVWWELSKHKNYRGLSGFLSAIDDWFLAILCIFLLIVFFIPFIVALTLRLHDSDHSGYWLFLPLLGAISFAIPDIIPLQTSCIIFALSFLPVIIFFLQKGTEGENRFGFPPDLRSKPESKPENTPESTPDEYKEESTEEQIKEIREEMKDKMIVEEQMEIKQVTGTIKESTLFRD